MSVLWNGINAKEMRPACRNAEPIERLAENGIHFILAKKYGYSDLLVFNNSSRQCLKFATPLARHNKPAVYGLLSDLWYLLLRH
jgi:hypothetical protein